MMLYICNLYNIVNQLYLNFEKKKKSRFARSKRNIKSNWDPQMERSVVNELGMGMTLQGVDRGLTHST